MTVAFHGEQGSFTEAVAREEFPDARLEGRPRAAGVLDLVLDGRARRAVLPVETSGEGVLHEMTHLLASLAEKEQISIVGERWEKTRPALLAGAGTRLESVKRVMSSPRGLAESAEALRLHLPEAEWVEEASSAAAARRVAGRKGGDSAALASPAAAELFGLERLDAPFLSNHGWQTRYLILGPAGTQVDGANRTTLVLTPRTSAPNAFFRALTAVVGRRLAIHRVELLPRPEQAGVYRYLVDVEGDAAEDPLKAALNDARAFCDKLAVAGSYPARSPK